MVLTSKMMWGSHNRFSLMTEADPRMWRLFAGLYAASKNFQRAKRQKSA